MKREIVWYRGRVNVTPDRSASRRIGTPRVSAASYCVEYSGRQAIQRCISSDRLILLLTVYVISSVIIEKNYKSGSNNSRGDRLGAVQHLCRLNP